MALNCLPWSDSARWNRANVSAPGRRRGYEFQYQRTARATLTLLDDASDHVCVYCDWHDDYVIEVGAPPTRYVFHQVKGRSSARRPWTFSEFFGVREKKGAKPTAEPPAVSKSGLFPLMLHHHHNFGDSCAGLAFVTNAGIDPALSGFIRDVAAANDIVALHQSTKNPVRPSGVRIRERRPAPSNVPDGTVGLAWKPYALPGSGQA